MAMSNYTDSALTLEELVCKVYDVGGVKFGNYKLKSGIFSPVYLDLRVIVSYPDLMTNVAEFLWEAAKKEGKSFTCVCGVPYTALPLATCIAAKHDLPMLIRRKEAKEYGTKKVIEGKFCAGDVCLVVEDVVTSGSSVMETVDALRAEGLVVNDAVVLLDREQGGQDMLYHEKINLHSVCTMTEVLEILRMLGKLDAETVSRVRDFIKENKFSIPQLIKETHGDAHHLQLKTQVMSYSERITHCSHPLTRKLLSIMDKKKTNLCLSADLTSSQAILSIVDKVGGNVCMVKTHVDIVEDFSQDFVQKLVQLSEKHDFMIFEDRKFGDIGHTVQQQYKGGMYKIADWADIVTTHVVPGSGVVRGLKEVGLSRQRGCVLVAEMSSTGTLAKGDYSKAAVRIAHENKDFVIGFICQSNLTKDPDLIHMTPGVRLDVSGDALGQQYISPSSAIRDLHTDIIIVGRGILTADNPVAMAEQYQESGYHAYQELLT
ncbi:hypothetical protein ScPMuIL_016023 [Solemya velum]